MSSRKSSPKKKGIPIKRQKDTSDETRPSKRVKKTDNDRDGSPSSGRMGLLPKRDTKTQQLVFSDVPEFRPNLTPAEVLRGGAWGGGYFRPIRSSVTGKSHKDAWKELPTEWLKGLDIQTLIASPTYNPQVNKFGVDCGYKASAEDTFGLRAWEQSGWIKAQDPYGWFQWYCRFYQGRRSTDDPRQIQRWCSLAGPRGRFRNNLIGKVLAKGLSKKASSAPFEDPSISPVIRQTLWHWGYVLTDRDVQARKKQVT